MQEGLKKLLEGMGDLIDSGRLSGLCNDTVETFESQLCRLAKCDYAITTVSGTIGITLALEAARVGPGHEVIVPALSAFGTLAAVIRRGATAVIVDIDPRRLTICPRATMAALTPKTRAVIAVHAMGIAPDVAGLRDIAEGAFLLEDASQGFPGPLMGDAASVSFASGGKVLDLGEGGGVMTNDKFLGERIRRAACLGQSGVRVDGHAIALSGGHDSFGTSARMPALSAALGLYRVANMRKLLKMLKERHTKARHDAEALGLEVLGPARVPLALCFRGSPAAREAMAQRGYRLRPAQTYPAHLEPAALRHAQIRILPTPRADEVGIDLATIDLIRHAR